MIRFLMQVIFSAYHFKTVIRGSNLKSHSHENPVFGVYHVLVELLLLKHIREIIFMHPLTDT